MQDLFEAIARVLDERSILAALHLLTSLLSKGDSQQAASHGEATLDVSLEPENFAGDEQPSLDGLLANIEEAQEQVVLFALGVYC